MNTVYTETFPLTPIDRREVARYCGIKEIDAQTSKLCEECIAKAQNKIQNRVCYCTVDIKFDSGELDFGFFKTNSKLLVNHLENCKKAVIFAATVGIEIDRLIAKYSKISPSKAVMLGAIGAERIEALCDAFQDKVKHEYKDIVPRVSAGYGDIPLIMQKDIFSLLNPPKNIGLTLNESLLMSPTKSVTAVIGIK